VNLLVIPKRGGKNEQVFERGIQSLEETMVNGVKPSKFNLPDYPLALGSLGGNVRPPQISSPLFSCWTYLKINTLELAAKKMSDGILLTWLTNFCSDFWI